MWVDEIKIFKEEKKTFDWNSVYEIKDGGKCWKEHVDGCKAKISNIISDSSNYDSIEKCVEYAIKNGDHAAFVCYIINNTMARKKLFKKKLKQFLINNQEYKNFYIMKREDWIDYNKDPESIKPISYSGLYKWKNDETIPPREAILQLGLSLGLKADQMNELLICTGNPELYLLDPYDLTVFYYCNHPFVENVSFSEKMRIIKKSINHIVQKVSDGYYDNNIIKQASTILYRNGLPWTINDEIEEAIQTYIEDEKKDSVGLTHLLTDFYTDKANTSVDKCTNLDEFVDDYYKYGKKSVLTLKKYGYYRKVGQYFWDFPKYRKNLFGYGWNIKNALRNDYHAIDDHIKDIGFYKHLSHSDNKEFYFDALQIIWNRRCPDNVGDNYDHGGKRLQIRHIVEGRRTNKPFLSVKGKDGYGFYNENFDKSNYIKYCLATGHEEEIESFMELAGVWESNHLSKMKHRQKEIEASDALLIYAFGLRDAIIRVLESSKDPSKHCAKKDIVAFPFYEMLICIERDVLFSVNYLGIVERVNEYIKDLNRDLIIFHDKIGENVSDTDKEWFMRSK